jgi:hypothetical protein
MPSRKQSGRKSRKKITLASYQKIARSKGVSYTGLKKQSLQSKLSKLGLLKVRKSSRKSPRKSKGRKSPRKSKARKSPRKSKARKSPRKSKARKSPRKSKGRKSPRKSKARKSPRKSKARKSPRKSKARKSPRKSKARKSPKKSNTRKSITRKYNRNRKHTPPVYMGPPIWILRKVAKENKIATTGLDESKLITKLRKLNIVPFKPAKRKQLYKEYDDHMKTVLKK